MQNHCKFSFKKLSLISFKVKYWYMYFLGVLAKHFAILSNSPDCFLEAFGDLVLTVYAIILSRSNYAIC